MQLLRKIVLAIIAFVLILWGGASTQTNDLMLQGGGFIGLIAGIIILYIFGKMSFRAMGIFPSLVIIIGIISFIIYAIGGFRGGIQNVGHNLRSFLGQKQADTAENFSEGGEKENSPAFNINNFPQITSKAKVITADTLQINGAKLQLFGIDAPEINQTCANSQGRSYRCGQEAANWLKSWISKYNLTCHIMGQMQNGIYVGICSLGDYDIGAALVNAGWAVANRQESEIYIPYEDAARAEGKGLWGGRFYLPWDWRQYMQQQTR